VGTHLRTRRRPGRAFVNGRDLLRACYGSYAWVALLAFALPTSLLLAVTPGLRRRRSLVRRASQLFLAAIGSPVRVEGGAVEPHYPCIIVANHASYLDGIILTAALPPGFTYLIKQQMRRVPIASYILRRLGSAFVDRANPGDRKRIARMLLDQARSGDALGFFPEGTFDATPGLKPFQLGAFSAAARAGLPVVPVVIHGSRHKLPARRLLPAPGPLRIWICDPVASGGRSPRALMQLTRQAMLAHLDEPDLSPTEEKPRLPPAVGVSGDTAGGGYIPE
jgi:1-acyl-sn-glycerol-3-phosphate acyltransferase